MSKIDEMIKKLCPNGVEYKELRQVCDVIRGDRITKKDLIDDGKYPVMSGGVTFFGRYSKANRKANTITVAQYGSAGYVSFIKEDFWANDVCYSVIPCDFIDNRFLYYVLCHNQKHLYSLTTKAIPDCLPKERLESISIPVPPLEIQKEIVSILDNFTELTARRKQYEYYRDALLSFGKVSPPLTFGLNNEEVRWISMGELFEFKNGLSKGKEFFGRGTPFITFSDVFNHNFLHKSDIKSLVECSEEEKQKLHVGRGDVLFTRTSETAEDVGHSSVMLDDIGDCVFNGFTIRATPKTKELLPEYCAYCFCTDSFRNYVTKNCAFTTRASLTGSTIAEYKLPVPSLALQKRIANVLGNFDKICSDLNIGLPAEIGLRKKQYEYYRDRILSFDTNVNNSIHGG